MVPYPGVSNSDVIPFIQTGQRLDKPGECPSEVYGKNPNLYIYLSNGKYLGMT